MSATKTPKAVLRERNEIVKVASYGGHGMTSRGYTEVFRFRTAAGKNRSLYLAGDLKFLFNRQQLPLVRDVHLEGDVSKENRRAQSGRCRVQ